MSSRSIYPEKIALYFSNMNPLSAKILADIQAVENSAINSSLTYSEKSKIIDKHLIYDVIQRHKNHQSQVQRASTDSQAGSQFDITEDEEGNHVYDDPELDKDHEQALLQSVYPKRPEKYIYDDNTVYLDEHSEPFSYCTRSQTKFCELENLINDAPKNHRSSASKHLPLQFLSKSDSKSRLPSAGTPSSVTGERRSHREKKHAPPAPPLLAASLLNKRLSSDYDSDHSTNSNMNDNKFMIASSTESVLESPTRTPKKAYNAPIPVFGVPMMGFPQSNSSSALAKSDKKYNHTNHDESNLPQQVQNLDLIAELQAKLKLNKTKPPNPPPQQQQSPSTAKVTKPKAPPPPPPGDATKKLPGTAVKVTSPVLPPPPKPSSPPKSHPSPKLSDKTSKDEDFNVDVSSPCKIVSTKNVIYNKIDASKNESSKRYSTFIILAANPDDDEPKDGHSFGQSISVC